MKNLTPVLFIALGLFTAQVANGSEIIALEFFGANVTGRVELEVDMQSHGNYIAISGAGYQQFDYKESLALVFNDLGSEVNASPGGAFSFDNRIFLGSTDYLSENGLLFFTANQEINLYGVGDSKYRYYQQNGFWEDVEIFISLPGEPPIEVPEPHMPMLGAVALLSAWATRRRQRSH